MSKQILAVFFINFFLISVIVGQTVNDCSYKPPREGETWCFYSNMKLEFRNGSLSLSTLPSTLSFGKGCSSISDEEGNLILFSDGMKLWNKNAQQVASTLAGDLGSTQSSLIVPHPAGKNRYFIFTTHLLYPAPLVTKGLNYSLFDFNAPAVIDTVPPKKLLNETSEKLSGVKHGNGIDYWVVAHGWGDNSFVSYKVSKSGVDSIPVKSNVGSSHSGTLSGRNSVGYMKLSPEGSKLALAILGANIIEWFDFDKLTGKVSNARQIPSPDIGSPYGIEFSPDGNKLYFTTVNPSTNSTNNIYQVDLLTGSSPVLLNRLAYDFTALQLAVDGKIYGARFNKEFLGVIENPNRPDTACNLKEDGFSLNGNKTQLGLPNFIQSYFDIPAITFDTKCQGDDTYFSLTNPTNIDSVSWNFGDPASGTSNAEAGINPFHLFSDFGTYNVTATEWYNGRSFNTPAKVLINKLPPKSFDQDSLYILPRSAIKLDGGPLMNSYLWNDGSTLQTLEVSEPGYYHVTIIDTNCCQQSDTIKIVLLDLLVPNAFSPNHDGLNDRFHVIGPGDGISNYNFYIYNRWGQLLWENNNINNGWDGTYKGVDCPPGVYAWVMKFGVSGNLLKRDKVEKRGVLTIIR